MNLKKTTKNEKELEDKKVSKADEAEEVVDDAENAEETTDETPAEETVEAEATEETETEESTEDAPESQPAEGEEVAKEDESEGEGEEETVEKAEDGEGEEEVEEDEADSEEEGEEIIVKLSFDDLKPELEKFVTPLVEKVDALTEKFDTLTEKLAKQAPAEAGSDTKETTTEKAEKAEKTADASTEDVTKSGKSSEGASANEAILKSINELKESFETRIKALEDQPAPSKVVVFRKGQTEDGGEEGGENRVKAIETRLAEIAKVRDTDPIGYNRQPQLADEAMELIAEKRYLMQNKQEG